MPCMLPLSSFSTFSNHADICMCIYMYIYICIYKSLSLYIYIYIHTSVYRYVHVHMYRGSWLLGLLIEPPRGHKYHLHVQLPVGRWLQQQHTATCQKLAEQMDNYVTTHTLFWDFHATSLTTNTIWSLCLWLPVWRIDKHCVWSWWRTCWFSGWVHVASIANLMYYSSHVVIVLWGCHIQCYSCPCY
jgi:hypothetical protein